MRTILIKEEIAWPKKYSRFQPMSTTFKLLLSPTHKILKYVKIPEAIATITIKMFFLNFIINGRTTAIQVTNLDTYLTGCPGKDFERRKDRKIDK